jgi:hypothetical protein
MDGQHEQDAFFETEDPDEEATCGSAQQSAARLVPGTWGGEKVVRCCRSGSLHRMMRRVSKLGDRAVYCSVGPFVA